MTAAAADRARKCFALARSTTHPGERDAAVNRGLRILERAQLDPDRFDIPGRARPERPRVIVTEFHCDPAVGVDSDFLRAFSEAMGSKVRANMARAAAGNASTAETLRAFSDALRSGVVSGDDMDGILGKLRRD